MLGHVRGDYPAGAIIEGRRLVAIGADGYEFGPRDLTPYGEAEQVTVPDVARPTLYTISGVGPYEALVIPRRPGLDPAYHLLVPLESMRGRTIENDFGVPGLCRYRIEPRASCP